MPKKYDSTVARMAGNIAAAMATNISYTLGGRPNAQVIATHSVYLARAIVAETIRTEPPADPT